MEREQRVLLISWSFCNVHIESIYFALQATWVVQILTCISQIQMPYSICPLKRVSFSLIPQYFKDSSVKELSSCVGESASRPVSRKLVTTLCLILVELRDEKGKEKKNTHAFCHKSLRFFFPYLCFFFYLCHSGDSSNWWWLNANALGYRHGISRVI